MDWFYSVCRAESYVGYCGWWCGEIVQRRQDRCDSGHFYNLSLAVGIFVVVLVFGCDRRILPLGLIVLLLTGASVGAFRSAGEGGT